MLPFSTLFHSAYKGVGCMPHAVQTQSAAGVNASKNAEDEAKKASLESQVAEANEERNTKVGSVVDDEMQEKIKKALDRLPEDRKCPQGYAWVQHSFGFKCAKGGHSISWEELDKLAGSDN
ncbi:hypothetical protein BDR06DRAFT_975087 [Suillus hirtellus]|nr:hypothetical protein BDR06DRAFT_975087 [Suillus hirtellus]